MFYLLKIFGILNFQVYSFKYFSYNSSNMNKETRLAFLLNLLKKYIFVSRINKYV